MVVRGPEQDPPEPRPVLLTKIGKYSLKKGAAAEKFWPLNPTRLDDVTAVFQAEADVMPGGSAADFRLVDAEDSLNQREDDNDHHPRG